MEKVSQNNILKGLASYFTESGLLEKDIAENSLLQSTLNKTSFVDYLLKQKLLDETRVARATAEYFGLPMFDIKAMDVEQIPTEYLNIQLVRQYSALPLFKKHGLLYMAIADPTVENLYETRFLTGLDIRLLIVEASKLKGTIEEILNTVILSEISESDDETLSNISINAYKDENEDLGAYDVESAPVVNYVNKILLDAIEKNASDIHFERYEDTYRIRFRQQGILFPITAPPTKIANYLLARIKVMSNMDITEHRIPQDGRFKLIISKKRAVDFRVSVCPTLFGEKVVLRILDASSVNQGLEVLGMNHTQKSQLMNALSRSQGLILVTGPTGSGKSVTLYSSLNYLNSPDKNISTVEDPVEIPIQGINQVHVNTRTGMTFSVALRSFLRQDPDVIMVGEIRDLETAEIAIRASQTGHLVLSTLHTNSGPETITRLMNMGIASYNLASSLTLVIAQRLIRVLCDVCKQKENLPPEVLIEEGFKPEEIKGLQLYGPGSCDHCIRGYKGRMGIFEVMPSTPEVVQLILRGASSVEIAELAKKQGVNSLRDSGLEKVKEGVTSLAELNRVFK